MFDLRLDPSKMWDVVQVCSVWFKNIVHHAGFETFFFRGFLLFVWLFLLCWNKCIFCTFLLEIPSYVKKKKKFCFCCTLKWWTWLIFGCFEESFFQSFRLFYMLPEITLFSTSCLGIFLFHRQMLYWACNEVVENKCWL